MPVNKLEKLTTLLTLLKDQTLTPSEVEKFLVMVIEAIKKSKEEFKTISTENLEQIKNALAYIYTEHSDILQKIDEKNVRFSTEVQKKIDKIQNLLYEIQSNPPKDGQDGADGINPDPKDIVPLVLKEIPPVVLDTGEQIVNKINDLSTDDDNLKIDVSHIKGIEKLIPKQQTIIGGGIVGRDIVKDIDLSDQLDGVTKTFNTQAMWNVISVALSSYPYGALRKGIDFTHTPTSITFTDTIDASTQLAAGQQCILTIIQS